MEISIAEYLVVGIGGQGVIRAVQILSWAAMRQGYKVRTAETHGMAQRGGSVSSYLRFGNDVEGPLIPRGRTNTVLAFEASEAVRNFNYAGPKTTFLINDEIIVPPMIHQMNMEYPKREQIHKFLKDVSEKVYFIKASELATNLGNPRVMNVIMLGVLMGSGSISLNSEILKDAILELVPEKAHDINEKAYSLGIEKGGLIRRELND
ncbi:MAG: indolepyruvate oxidoreductase subunit beta [Candidatus Hermodarchaeota archaeon]